MIGKKKDDLVPCGLYRTTQPLGRVVRQGVLVYYHNHGNPGPGVYMVESWLNNKAIFSKRGILVSGEAYARTMLRLKDEGFYRVVEDFICCEKRCRHFERETLVQLGYNGNGMPILFVPEWSHHGLILPHRGNFIQESNFRYLQPVKVVFRFDEEKEEEEEEIIGFPGRVDSKLLH